MLVENVVCLFCLLTLCFVPPPPPPLFPPLPVHPPFSPSIFIFVSCFYRFLVLHIATLGPFPYRTGANASPIKQINNNVQNILLRRAGALTSFSFLRSRICDIKVVFGENELRSCCHYILIRFKVSAVSPCLSLCLSVRWPFC